MLRSKTLEQLLEETASSSPVPAGGSVACIVGALGVALVEMVGNLTVHKEKYRDFESRCLSILEKAQELRGQLMQTAHDDMDAFLPVKDAFVLPRTNLIEQKTRDEALQRALVGATQVPFTCLNLSLQVLYLACEMAVRGNKLLLSDCAIASELCRSAAKSSYVNVLINTKLMKDTEVSQNYNDQAKCKLAEVEFLSDELFVYATSQLQ